MAGRRGWREPILALTGFALAIGSAGIGILVVDRVREDDNLIVYSSEPSPSPTTASGQAPTPIVVTATPEASATARTAEATATATTAPATAAATATPTRIPATPTRVPSTPTKAPTTPATPTPAPTRTPTPTSGLSLTQSTFTLPGDATPNGGSTIGPFCCQGRTVTLTTTSSEIVGYAYWYKWVGTAYNLPRDGSTAGALPNVQVLIHDPTVGESSILFTVSEATAGATKTVDHGRLRFTVTITSAEATTYQGVEYVWESSLGGRLEVQAR